MTLIIGMSDLLKDSNPSPDQLQHLRTIDTAGNHLLGVIDNILDISRIEAGELKLRLDSIDICELVNRVLELFRIKAEKKGLQLLTDYGDNLDALISGDNYRIEQVIKNPLDNAIKFTRQGSVTVCVKTGWVRKA